MKKFKFKQIWKLVMYNHFPVYSNFTHAISRDIAPIQALNRFNISNLKTKHI